MGGRGDGHKRVIVNLEQEEFWGVSSDESSVASNWHTTLAIPHSSDSSFTYAGNWVPTGRQLMTWGNCLQNGGQEISFLSLICAIARKCMRVTAELTMCLGNRDSTQLLCQHSIVVSALNCCVTVSGYASHNCVRTACGCDTLVNWDTETLETMSHLSKNGLVGSPQLHL